MNGPTDVHVDEALICAFEDQLDPVHPERGEFPARIVGYGEISTVFLIGDQDDTVYKRMAGFAGLEQAQRHADAVHTYCAALLARGVNAIPTKTFPYENRHGEHVLYLAQPRLEAAVIGNRLLERADDTALRSAVGAVFTALVALWQGNTSNAHENFLGIDGQISNWAFPNGPGQAPVYLDVGLPLLRRNGRELLDLNVVYKTMPPIVRQAVRAAFGQEVLDRYYAPREVLVNLLANFHKEGYFEKIDAGIACVNQALTGPSRVPVLAPINRTEVNTYYRRDARIWRIFLNVRRADRFLRHTLLRQRYPFVLPGEIRR